MGDGGCIPQDMVGPGLEDPALPSDPLDLSFPLLLCHPGQAQKQINNPNNISIDILNGRIIALVLEEMTAPFIAMTTYYNVCTDKGVISCTLICMDVFYQPCLLCPLGHLSLP